MIDFQPNSTARIFLSLVEDNAPLLGAVVTVTVTNPQGETIVDGQLAYEEGGGVYSYTLEASQTSVIGTYFAIWRVTSPTTIEQRTTFTVAYQSVYSLTRLDVRHFAASLLEGGQNFLLGTVQASAATSLIDGARVEPEGQLVGGKLYIYAGTGMGQERIVTAHDPTTGTLTINRAWDTLPDLTSRYEWHKLFSVEEYNKAIRLALVEVMDQSLVPISDSSLTISPSQYEYTIPAGFAYIFAVQVRLSDGRYLDVAPACWDIMRAMRALKIHPRIVHAHGGNKLRLLGLRPPVDPLDDMTGIDVRPIYMIKKACSYLCFSKMQSRENEPGGWTTKHQLFEAEAEFQKQFVRQTVPNNTRKVEI